MLRSFRVLSLAAAASVALLSVASTAQAAVLYNVDCGTATSAVYTGAGVLGASGDVWNSYVGGSWVSPTGGATLTLKDSTGSSSAVTVKIGNYSNTSNNVGGNPSALMSDYICSGGSTDGWPTLVDLAGLPASTAVSLVVYSAGDTAGQGATITLTDANGSTVKTTSGLSRDITAGEGVAYDTFSATTKADGTLHFEVASTTGWHALNGMQVAVPEPASLGILAVSAMGLVARRRRQA